MKVLRNHNQINDIKFGLSFIYISDMAYYEESLNTSKSIWIATKCEVFKELKKIVEGKVFLDFLFQNGVRASNVLSLGHRESLLLQYHSTPVGQIYYEESRGFASDIVEFISNSAYIFEFASKNQEAKAEIKRLKAELKDINAKTNPEAKENKKAEIKAVEFDNLTGHAFKSMFSIPNSMADLIASTEILYLAKDAVLLRKTQEWGRMNYEERFSEFYNKNQGIFTSNEEVLISLEDVTVFEKKSFEQSGEARQPLTQNYISAEAEAIPFSNNMLPSWESDSSREIEKPALPLPKAHLVNALTSGILQGSMYTNRGEALIKGSTIKVEKRIGGTVEDFYENRQMVFYKDEYRLSRENSSVFIEQNLRELSSMLKSIGQTVDPSNVKELMPLIKELSKGSRPDLPGQVIKTIANYVLQLKYGFSIYNGEPGIGKTQVSFSVARLLSLTEFPEGGKIAFICDGAKHIGKMMNEAGLVVGKNAIVKVVRTLKHVDQMIADKPEDGMIFVYVISKDTAKRETAFKAISNLRKCPTCGTRVVKKDVEERRKIIHSSHKIADAVNVVKNKSEMSCGSCGDKLMTPSSKTNETGSFMWGSNKKAESPLVKKKGFKPAESFGHYLRRKLRSKKLFNFLIVDEAHGMTADHSAQTQMMRDFITVSDRTMLMTGTLSNGYASSLYFLLYAVMPKRLKEWGFDIENKGLTKWIDSYGARKKTSRGGSAGTPQEKAIINPTMVMHHLAPFTVWGKIEDLNYPMPKYSESVEVASLEPEILDAMSKTHAEAVNILESLPEEAKPSFGAITKSMLYMSNNPFKSYTLRLKYKGEIIGQVITDPIFTDETYITHKERKMLEIVKKNLAEDRKIMIYTYFNKTAFSYERIAKVLEMELPDLSFAVMPDSLKSEKIADWFETSAVKHDVVIVPYKRVATGLDIPQYPEIVFYEEEYNIREIIQASRRPYRAVIQKRDVHVNHLVQAGPQSIAMKLISEKIAASKIVEGEVYSEDGVESYSVDSIEIALKQRLAEGIGNLEVPDFATTEIEEGRGRPWTTLEQTYIDEVSANNADALADIVPESVSDIHTVEEEDDIIEESESTCAPEEDMVESEKEDVVIDDEFQPVVFGYEIISKTKNRKKVVESGILPDDISALKNRISAQEKVQLTFF